ncbi:MAG: AAA family ATPase, partial [bacterium]|nr:AAA family ATPase [bacterium]
MIEKILRIKGIGRFIDFDPSILGLGGKLGKITVGYAENAKGKTTLASILRSLKDGNVRELKQRKSIGGSGDPEIHLEAMGQSISCLPFASGWSSILPNIEIFDAYFVNDNIYSGLEISSDHKRELHKFIVGEQGIQLAQLIEQCKKNILEKNQNIRDLDVYISQLTSGKQTAETFVTLLQDPIIDQKINEKEKQIATTKASVVIQTKLKYFQLKTLALLFTADELIDIFHATVATIQANFLKIVEDHKKSFTDPGLAGRWIKFGLENIHDKKCPFCFQNLTKSDNILEAYRQFFNKEYEALLASISAVMSMIRDFSLESYESEWGIVNAKNDGLDEFWGLHLSLSKRAMIDSAVVEGLRQQMKHLQENIELKENDPLTVRKYDTQAQTIFDALTKINKAVSIYNTSVDTANMQIDKLREATTPSLIILEEELAELKLQKLRFDASVAKLCIEFCKVQEDLKKLNEEKDQKKIALEAYTGTMLGQYGSKINDYLIKLGTDFRVDSQVTSQYVGSAISPIVEYGLVLDGCPVAFDDNGQNICVKYSLSEGDKNSLALAFFLARLDVDSNLANKIIVFDDPLTSHDINRKDQTIIELMRLAKRSTQLILFSHDKFFARRFWDELSKDRAMQPSMLALKIRRAGTGSIIEPCNLELETSGSHIDNLLTLEKYLVQGCATDAEFRNVARCIRPLLEGYLMLRFPGKLRGHGLGKMIETINGAVVVDRLVLMK